MQSFLLLFIIITVKILLLVHADPPYNVCSTTSSYTYDTIFHTNLQNLMPILASNASVSKVYNASTQNGTNTIYAQYLCLHYIDNITCSNCVSVASKDIVSLCPKITEAVVWEEKCQLRYSKTNFLGRLDVSENIPKYNQRNISDPDMFKLAVTRILISLTNTAAFNRWSYMYATEKARFGATETIYAMVQCATDLSSSDCNTCLQVAIVNVSSCCYFSRGARLLSRSCYLRYELYAFYEDKTSEDSSSEPKQGAERSRRLWIIIMIALAAAIVVVTPLSFFVYYVGVKNGIKRWKNKITSEENNQDFHNIQAMETLNSRTYVFMDLASIQVATDNFSESNMLGQGGFGPVYKGVLKDGCEVAVKRLSSCSEQGTEEFTNEVMLIMKLQHKNLVRLLGFCVEKEEKILVYEFLPNNSLEVFLFDPRKRAHLDWRRRINIINGIARGILYLHVDSRLKIIHRDLKASNILLDNNMNPKISDFGTARIFAGSENEANTRKIVGTYGYMSPEYAMEGLYSTKSDVFSFGVLLLEIITGRRNVRFHKSNRAPSLLAYAWHLHNEGNELELVDPSVIESCCSDEFSRYLHVGLLCVQEDACDRPSMSSVVMMLRSENSTLPPPERPALSVGTFIDHEQAILINFSANNLTISDILPR